MRRKISKFNIDHIILFEMDWIDSCMKKWKTYIFMIFVVIWSGASEVIYSENICIANGSDDFGLLSVLDKSKINNEIRIKSGVNTITAGQAIYDEGGGSINISGGITLENPDLLIEGQQALINTDSETAVIENANYFFFKYSCKRQQSGVSSRERQSLYLD